MITYYECCAGISMQGRGLDNALELIGLEKAKCVGISEVAPKALIGNAILNYGLTQEKADWITRDIEPEEMARILTEKNVGKYEGTQTKPVEIDWYSKTKGKSLGYLRMVFAADWLTKNSGDMTKVAKLPEGLDILFLSTPCTSVAVCGLRTGFEKDSGTRSAIAQDAPRLINSVKEKPKYIIFENVKGMVSGKNLIVFQDLVQEVSNMGYNSYQKVLNAKECGVPQNRERVFFIGIRKDIDTGRFEFPKPFDTGVRLKDILDTDIEEKYFINTDKAKQLILKLYKNGELTDDVNGCDGTIYDPHVKDYSNCIKARYDMGVSNLKTDGCMIVYKVKPNEVNQIGNICVTGKRENPNQGRVYDTEGVAPTINTMQGGNRQPMIVAVRGRYTDKGTTEQQPEPNKTGFTNTITTVNKDNYLLTQNNPGLIEINEDNVFDYYRIRKLTPEECFVLMGLTKEDCKLCRENGLVNTDLYKIAGNGLVTNCIDLIIQHLYKAQTEQNYMCTDEFLG